MSVAEACITEDSDLKALVQRHQVDAATDDSGLMSGMLARLKNMRRLWTSA